jgi:ribosomal-protein-alanine N-acetyltransferase
VYYFIEPMLEEHISEVQQIERASYNLSWSTNTYRRELRNPSSSRYIIARTSPVLPPSPRMPTHHEQSPPRRNGLLGTLLPGVCKADREAPHAAPIAGYAGVWLAVDEAHITTIAVAPRYRGQGVGELLLSGLIDQALNLHATMLTLEVRISNIVAQNLYLKYGFRATGRRPRYYTDNGEDALIMWTDSIQSATYQAQLAALRQALFRRLRAQAETAAQPPPIEEPAPVPPSPSLHS